MTHPDTRANAERHADAATALMLERGIPTTPQNFTIWYSYVAGRHPCLTEEIDGLLAAGKAFDPEVSDRLFAKYFGVSRTAEQFHRSSAQLRAAIDNVMGRLGKVDKDAGDYDLAMTDFSGEVDRLDGTGDIQDLIRRALSETRIAAAQNWALEQSFEAKTAELNTLRDNLEQLTKEATTDALTGIANRKHFDATLRREAKQADADGTPLCLLLADVDHFKLFNDTFGHRVGDMVLQSVAGIIDRNVKGQDLAARYGGEEFAVILPRTLFEDAFTVAEDIRQALASKELTHRESGKSYGTVTLSIGLAQRRPGEAPDDLIDRADDALYRAKDAGRNRVVLDVPNATKADKTKVSAAE